VVGLVLFKLLEAHPDYNIMKSRWNKTSLQEPAEKRFGLIPEADHFFVGSDFHSNKLL